MGGGAEKDVLHSPTVMNSASGIVKQKINFSIFKIFFFIESYYSNRKVVDTVTSLIPRV